jgi:uncharacterized protein YqjF (DUF2071 family)
MNVAEATTGATSETKRKSLVSPSFEPLFLGDWERAMFIHYEVDAKILQSGVPFALDLWNGRAFVSLVAFRMRRLRPRFGGRISELLLKPIADSRYLNVRTYVRHKDEPGIYFIAEFLSNPLCVPLGSPTFGLPYRFGRLNYRHHHENGSIAGEVRPVRGAECLTYNATLAPRAAFHACRPGTLEAFLLERYTAFTGCGSKRRLFRIGHSPWPQVPVKVAVEADGLLAAAGKWRNHARLVGANYSPGVRDVRMGSPQRIHSPARKRRLTVFFDI